MGEVIDIDYAVVLEEQMSILSIEEPLENVALSRTISEEKEMLDEDCELEQCTQSNYAAFK